MLACPDGVLSVGSVRCHNHLLESFTSAAQISNQRAKLGDRQNVIRALAVERRPRHTGKHRVTGILDHREPARPANGRQPRRAITPHTGHDNADDVRSKVRGCRAEQHVDLGAHAVFTWPIGEMDMTGAQSQMEVR